MPSRALVASALVYSAVTAWMARGVIARLSTALVGGSVDPALNAAILAWTATNIPWTQRWFDFPIFHPAADALTFSEHLLGLSVLATPLYWLSGDVVVAYNLTALATYVLCGLATCGLVGRLSGSPAAGFIAGFAFAFAPYRLAQVSHIQVLAVFWAPLALLGLHAYLDTGRWRWLAVFGASWMMQGAANGYFLVFFSVLVGFWVLWFVVAQKRWRDLGMIAAAGLLASLPLVPIVLHFMGAHARYLLTRPFDEVRFFSADVSAVLCAPPLLSVRADYGGVCRPEGELFPGLALLTLACIGACVAWRRFGTRSRAQWVATAVSGTMLVAAMALFTTAVAVAVKGGLAATIGPWRLSAATVQPPFSQGVVLLLLAAALSPSMRRAVGRASIPAFYLVMAIAMWVLSWGPTPLLYGRRALAQGPYAWLMVVPGIDGLRVPARFWMMAVLCLCIAMGATLGAAFRRRRPATAWLVAIVCASALAVDGWSFMPSDTLPPSPPRPDLIRGGVAITLPIGNPPLDAAAELDAIRGGWSSVNGYSGYEAPHYSVLRYATLNADEVLLAPFMARGDLHVIVAEDSPALIALVERQPGVQFVGAGNGRRQYRLPRGGTAASTTPVGERLPIAGVSVSCAAEAAGLATDGDPATRWECGPQKGGQQMIADLGALRTIGQVVPGLGGFASDFPKQVVVDTSVDSLTWTEGWIGGVLPEAFEAVVADARAGRIVLTMPPRSGRYVRLRLASNDDVWYWSIAELEVWSGAP